MLQMPLDGSSVMGLVAYVGVFESAYRRSDRLRAVGAHTRSVACPCLKLGPSLTGPALAEYRSSSTPGICSEVASTPCAPRTAPTAICPFRLCAAAATASAGSLNAATFARCGNFVRSAGDRPAGSCWSVHDFDWAAATMPGPSSVSAPSGSANKLTAVSVGTFQAIVSADNQ